MFGCLKEGQDTLEFREGKPVSLPGSDAAQPSVFLGISPSTPTPTSSGNTALEALGIYILHPDVAIQHHVDSFVEIAL